MCKCFKFVFCSVFVNRFGVLEPPVQIGKRMGRNLHKLLCRGAMIADVAHSGLEGITRNTNDLRQNYLGFWYQKIARATKATVMIQRMMSLARFFSFSSAIGAVQHT
jgi:hypothetical protein